jgi:hypothetical protein
MAARTPRGLKMLSSLCPEVAIIIHWVSAAAWYLSRGITHPQPMQCTGDGSGVAKQAGWCLAGMADAKAELHLYCTGGVCTP